MENSDLRTTRQIIYQSKGNYESVLKMQILLKLSDLIKDYGHSSGILVYSSDFTVSFHLLFSNHWILVANFLKF